MGTYKVTSPNNRRVTGSLILTVDPIEVNGYWRDAEENDIEETFWGSTLRFHIEPYMSLITDSNIRVKMTIKANGIETEILDDNSLCFFTLSQKNYVEVRIKDRWELPESLRSAKEAVLWCEVSAHCIVVKKYISSIRISEFKVVNGFITAGTLLRSLPGRISVINTRDFTEDINGIILHRTDSSTVGSALYSASRQAAAHLYVDRNGDVYQVISLLQQAPHVGRIRPRNEPNTPSTQRVFDQERIKSYPDRFPFNIDSVGIEVVGRFLARDSRWEAVESEQAKSTARLTNFLLGHFSLQRSNIYPHEIISSKTAGEGQVVYDAIKNYLIM